MAEMSKIDLRGIFIPETVWKIEIKMKKLEDGDRLLALLDDPDSEEWILRWAHRNDHEIASVEKVATGIHITITKGGFR